MSGPFKVDPGQLDSAGQQWRNQSSGFDTPAPDVSGNSSTHRAAQQAIADSEAATQRLKAMIGQTGSDAQAGASAYQTQEQQSAGGLSGKDGSGILSDLVGESTSLFGVGPQLIGAATGLIGSSAGVIGSLTGAATSLAKTTGPQQNSNNTNPEPGHDYVPPPQADTIHPEDAIYDGGHW